MSLLDRVRHTIRRHRLAGPGTRVVVALSGGSDSVALALLIAELAAAGELCAAGAAHFNHQLRDRSDRDERLATGVAERLGWPVVADREDVRSRARRERRSLEDAAHAARYEFFERARNTLRGDVVALGHTRDDQAETFLLRLLRGAGPRGLAAMHPRRGAIVRPLLDCRRAELRAYLDPRGIAYVDDESNQDVAIPRNRVRAELIPLLAARFNPRIVDVLADEAAIARDEWEWMMAAAGAPRRELDIDALRAAPVALRRLVVWLAMTDAAAGRSISFEHVAAALELLEAPDATGIDAPGQRVQRIGPRLVLSTRVGRGGRESPANFFRYPLSIPGEVRLPEAGFVVSAEYGDGSRVVFPPRPIPNDLAIVRSEVCRAPLAVRNRRPGDWFRPLGLRGRKKLQDFFVDRKVARRDRDTVPLVVDETDRIVWVAGHAIDAQFRVTDPAEPVLILRLRHLGGPA